VPPGRLASLGEQLDDRICRLDIDGENDHGSPSGEH
jgi:hypothetical protein